MYYGKECEKFVRSGRVVCVEFIIASIDASFAATAPHTHTHRSLPHSRETPN